MLTLYFISLCFYGLAILDVHKKNANIVIFLDPTKASDHVPHERLLLKIKSYV